MRTTFFTGMLTNLAEEVVDLLLSRCTRRDRTLFASSLRPSHDRITLLGSLWLVFLVAASPEASGPRGGACVHSPFRSTCWFS